MSTGKEFTPILFSPDYEDVALLDVNGVELADVNGVLLYARDTGYGEQRDFSTHGLGILTDAISCHVEEVRNDLYELEMQYPVSGAHFSEIALRSIIIARANYTDDPQAFRVYHIEKPINLICTIYARHISGDLSGVPVEPFSANGIQAAMRGLIEHAMAPVPFTLYSTRSTSSTFKVDVPSSIRSWMGGKDGSLLDVYGGEWHFDNYTATLENARGADRGVIIAYGKNLTDLRQEERCDEVYTGVLAYWQSPDGDVVYGSIQKAPGSYAFTKIYTLDCSTDFEEMPEASQLDAKAADYIEVNNVGVPKVSLTLDFVQAGDLLERIDLCDTVTVRFEKLRVEAKAKCIRTKWNVLLGRYDEIELGDARTTLADTIHDLQDAAGSVKNQVSSGLSVYDAKAAQFKNLIAQSYGLYQSEITDPVLGGNSYALHNMSAYDDSTFAVLFNASGLFMLTRSTTADEWTVTSGTAADGYGLVKVLTAVGIKADWVNIGGSGQNGTLYIYDTEDNVIGEWGAEGIRIYEGAIDMAVADPNEDIVQLEWEYDQTTAQYRRRGTNTATLSARLLRIGYETQVISGNITETEKRYCDISPISLDAIYYGDEDYASTSSQAAQVRCEDGVMSGSTAVPSNIYLYTSTGARAGSDRRLKENITDMPEMEKFVSKLRPVSFSFRGKAEKHWGFIAQEVLETEEGLDVNIVSQDEQSGYYVMDYTALIPVLVKTIQEQQKQINFLESALMH